MRKQPAWIPIPRYAYIPLIVTPATNFFVYYFSRVIARDMRHYDLSLPIDRVIPFVGFFMLIYVLAYVQWFAGYILIGRENRRACYFFCAADIIAKLICFVLFIALPTSMDRPDAAVAGSGPLYFLTKLIFSLDPPNNLFPSIHCLESWFCLRAAFAMKKPPRWYRSVSVVFTLLVCASTVFVRQHVVVDILGGIVVAEIGILICRLTHADRLFYKTEPAFAHDLPAAVDGDDRA